ncbi:MAG TPA: serine protease, partial [Bacteroidales bacterium]|nr:serine protease [Bacteroidales bacterium]
MKRFSILLIVFLLSFRVAYPVEGMWLPLLLEQLNEPEMKSMGMRISAEDIYSINKSSLKDAILLFGRGCTAEIISDEGLILTNHHCGYGQIQRHSSLENDYL